MNALRDISASAKRTWRVIALSAVVLLIVAGGLASDHNRGRFMAVPTSDGYSAFAIDTHTGRFCDPMPKGMQGAPFPKCADLAKDWR
jgi:hypothetical protein